MRNDGQQWHEPFAQDKRPEVLLGPFPAGVIALSLTTDDRCNGCAITVYLFRRPAYESRGQRLIAAAWNEATGEDGSGRADAAQIGDRRLGSALRVSGPGERPPHVPVHGRWRQGD